MAKQIVNFGIVSVLTILMCQSILAMVQDSNAIGYRDLAHLDETTIKNYPTNVLENTLNEYSKLMVLLPELQESSIHYTVRRCEEVRLRSMAVQLVRSELIKRTVQ